MKELRQALKRLKRGELPAPGLFRVSLDRWKATLDWAEGFVPGAHRWIADGKWQTPASDLQPAASNGKHSLTDEERRRRLGGRGWDEPGPRVAIDIGGRKIAGVIETTAVPADSEPSPDPTF